MDKARLEASRLYTRRTMRKESDRLEQISRTQTTEDSWNHHNATADICGPRRARPGRDPRSPNAQRTWLTNEEREKRIGGYAAHEQGGIHGQQVVRGGQTEQGKKDLVSEARASEDYGEGSMPDAGQKARRNRDVARHQTTRVMRAGRTNTVQQRAEDRRRA